MPWKIKEQDGQFCVIKEGETDPLKCYSDKGKAEDYLKALYANAKDMSWIVTHFSELEETSIDERLKALNNAFYAITTPSPNPRDFWIKESYDDYVLITNGKDVYKVGYKLEGGVVTFDPAEDWKLQKFADAGMGLAVYTELQGTTGVFDGLAASHDVAFVAMSGEELFIEADDLETYMQNGSAVIESTRTSSGDVIGLPIDLVGHDHKGGAGWVKGFELDKVRNIVRFLVEWTEEGANLIKSNMRRFFSPTVDPINKVILGGSLTNWPATRNSMGQLLLQPIELSQTMKGLNMPTIEELLARLEALENKSKPPAKPTPPSSEGETAPEEIGLELEQLLEQDDQIDQLGELAQARAKEMARVSARKSHVVEFVSKVVGGTSDHPVGLPIHARELTKLLLSLPEKQSLAVERLLGKVWDSAIDFSEHGVATGNEFNLRKAVPKEYAELLRSWVAAGNTARSFFEINPEAGSADEYNLSAYIVKEKV